MRLRQPVPVAANEVPTTPVKYSEGRAWVRVRGAFFPDLIEARPGERLRLVFRREETAACSERVVFPSLGKSVMLPPFEDVAVDLGPLPPGEHEFRCQLGVLRGRIRARGQVRHASIDAVRGRIVIRAAAEAQGRWRHGRSRQSEDLTGRTPAPTWRITSTASSR